MTDTVARITCTIGVKSNYDYGNEIAYNANKDVSVLGTISQNIHSEKMFLLTEYLVPYFERYNTHSQNRVPKTR